MWPFHGQQEHQEKIGFLQALKSNNVYLMDVHEETCWSEPTIYLYLKLHKLEYTNWKEK